MIGFAIFPRHHSYNLTALHLRLEPTTHTAVGAGSDLAVLSLTNAYDGFFGQRRGRASLHTGAAGHALGFHEGFILSGCHARLEAATIDRQREGALRLFAGTHTAITDDAF